jgi:hypothetical protein
MTSTTQPNRAQERATTHVSKPERVIHRMIVKLRRVRQFAGAAPGATVMFTFEGGTLRSHRSRCSFVRRDQVPEFEGEEGWFEVEQVSAKPWPYWRAVRQVEPLSDA